MKKTQLIILLTFWALQLSAQQPRITLGTPYPVIDAQTKLYFSKGDEIMSVKVAKRNVILQKMSMSKLALLKMREYDDFPKGVEIELIKNIKDRYYLFFSRREDQEIQLLAREIDFADGTFVGPAKKILSVNQRMTGFDYIFSDNENTMAVQYRLVPEVRNDAKSYDLIGFYVFDSDLHLQWGNILKMPYTEKKMNNLSYAVDSKGNGYMVTTVYDDETTREKKRGTDDPNYHLEILKVLAGSSDLTSIPVSLEGHFIQNIRLYENANGVMTCAGYYNKHNGASADGVITFKLNDNNQLSDFKTFEIPLDILNQNISARARKKNEKQDDEDKAEFAYLSLRRIISMKDGSMLLIGEQRYSQTYTTYNPYTHLPTTHTVYYYNDMLVTKIDAQGNLAWMKKLPKRQQSGAVYQSYFGPSFNGQAIGALSFKYLEGPGYHVLLYLDNAKNIGLADNEVPVRHMDGAGGYLVGYIVDDATGNVKKQPILNVKDVKGQPIYQFTPRRIEQVTPSAFVFEAYIKNKEDILIGVEL